VEEEMSNNDFSQRTSGLSRTVSKRQSPDSFVEHFEMKCRQTRQIHWTRLLVNNYS
jgi:hypothetical protein